MIGIEEIGIYLPSSSVSNYDQKEKFDMDDYFIESKIGVRSVTRMLEDEDTSDMGVKAFQDLQKKTDLNLEEIECLFVVSQNPDYNLPHTSAIIHGKLDLPENCACFDISLGCSGFVYGLSVIESFLEQNKMKKGVLITADPYSKVINPEDKNTSILFGDGAAATLISNNPKLVSGEFSFGTRGKEYEGLICENNVLSMNGHAIFNFAAKTVPGDVKNVLAKNNLGIEDIDCFVFHQGSKYIVDTLRKRLKLDPEKVPFAIGEYGNTISSSLPIILSDLFDKRNIKQIVISGFGVGLSWASAVLKRV
jgi:3-oxoacyl-[acyl-carrier-protein] synthase III